MIWTKVLENLTLQWGLMSLKAPCKIKILRANEAPFMDRDIKKAIMNRSRLKNRCMKSPSEYNNIAYKTQRNYCTN